MPHKVEPELEKRTLQNPPFHILCSTLFLLFLCSCQNSKTPNRPPEIFVSKFYVHYGDSLHQIELIPAFDSISQQYTISPVYLGDTITFAALLYSPNASIQTLVIEHDSNNIRAMLAQPQTLSPILSTPAEQYIDTLSFLPGYSAIPLLINYYPRTKNTLHFSLQMTSDNEQFPSSRLDFTQPIDTLNGI